MFPFHLLLTLNPGWRDESKNGCRLTCFRQINLLKIAEFDQKIDSLKIGPDVLKKSLSKLINFLQT